jgi:hypothetical protein
MVKSDLLASGGRVGGPAGAIQVIPNRFGRSAFAAYGEDAAVTQIEYKEIGPGDTGAAVKALATMMDNKIESIGYEAYKAFDQKRPRYVAGSNQYDAAPIETAKEDGVYTPALSLQVGILQKYLKEQKGVNVDVIGEADERTWRAFGLDASTPVTKKPKPVSTGGGGGGSKTAVKGGGDVTPPSTPLWQKPWFMPAAIGVGVLGVVGAIIFWPSKKAEQ